MTERATSDKAGLIGRAERERLYPSRSDRSPGAGGGDPEHGRAGGIGISTGTARPLHVHQSDGAGLAASCEARAGAPLHGQGATLHPAAIADPGASCEVGFGSFRRSAGWQRACTACNWMMLTSV